MKKMSINFCLILNNSHFLCFAGVSLIPKTHETIRSNAYISKYREFVELKVLGYGTKSDKTSKIGTIFLLLHDIFFLLLHEGFESEADR